MISQQLTQFKSAALQQQQPVNDTLQNFLSPNIPKPNSLSPHQLFQVQNPISTEIENLIKMGTPNRNTSFFSKVATPGALTKNDLIKPDRDLSTEEANLIALLNTQKDDITNETIMYERIRNESDYHCPFCDRHFSRRYHLCRHLRSVHKNISTIEDLISKIPSKKDTASESERSSKSEEQGIYEFLSIYERNPSEKNLKKTVAAFRRQDAEEKIRIIMPLLYGLGEKSINKLFSDMLPLLANDSPYSRPILKRSSESARNEDLLLQVKESQPSIKKAKHDSGDTSSGLGQDENVIVPSNKSDVELDAIATVLKNIRDGKIRKENEELRTLDQEKESSENMQQNWEFQNKNLPLNSMQNFDSQRSPRKEVQSPLSSLQQLQMLQNMQAQQNQQLQQHNFLNQSPPKP